MSAIKKFEERVWQEAEDEYLSCSPLERQVCKLQRMMDQFEELERDEST